jgi:NADH-quinone oxidoreductase subunit N
MTSLTALLPLLSILGGSLVLLLVEAFFRREDTSRLGYLSVLFIGAGGFFTVRVWGGGASFFDGVLVLDRPAVVLVLVFLSSGFLVVLMSLKYLALQGMNHGEYYPLLLLALCGMVIMVTSGNLLVVFLGLEVLSVASYALTGLKKNDRKSSEAAIKYFLMGSLAAAFLVLGLAFLYGAAGSLDIGEVLSRIQAASSPSPLGLAGLALVTVAFAFKMALVPFHMWAPDVYEGAPTPVTAFLSTGPKLAGVAVLFRLLGPKLSSGSGGREFLAVLGAVAVATMVLGNLAALRQSNLKRLLAYSSIAHSGYILLAVIAADGTSLVFYLVVYLFMNAGAFSALVVLGRKDREYGELEDLAGLGFRYPWIAASLSVLLLSLAGFPPTAGFLAKFYVFSAAVREGFVGLVVVAVLASLVSVFYYLRIVVVLYMREPGGEVRIEADHPGPHLVLFFCLYAVLQLGILPGNLLAFIRRAFGSFF